MLVEKSTKAQFALLKKALRILKPGEEMVYSTCSILKEENEDNAVKKFILVEVVFYVARFLIKYLGIYI